MTVGICQSKVCKGSALCPLLLSLLILGGCRNFEPEPTSVVRRFIRFVEEGRIDEAMSLTASDSTVVFSRMHADMLHTDLCSGIESIEIERKCVNDAIPESQEEVHGIEVEFVTSVVTYRGGCPYRREDWTLVRLDHGSWKILRVAAQQ